MPLRRCIYVVVYLCRYLCGCLPVQVFIISVLYSDSSSQLLYRRYNHFFNLQMKLLDLFPEEGGERDPKHRIIPLLPGKVVFGRSQVRDVAVRRLKHLDNYCQALVRLPPRISQSEEVLKFFEPKPEDLNPPKDWFTACFFPSSSGVECGDAMSGDECLCVFVVAADYQRQENTEISLRAGERVEVIEKNDTGIGFSGVKAGVMAEQMVNPSVEECRYVTVQAYSSSGRDELGFERGVTVEVIQKNQEGWWFIRSEGREGWAPASYLRKVEEDVAPGNQTASVETGEESAIGPVEIIGNLMEISNLLNRRPASDTYSGFQLPQPPDAPSVDVEYYTIAEFHSCLSDGISFGGGEKAEVTHLTLTRPKVPPPAPPIKKQTSLPCMESDVMTL
uniref:Uncharacterized protein n=1 Tax=Astyanax mexicanus TaxID=7994 RepID=A0A8B9LK57_ASTMX